MRQLPDDAGAGAGSKFIRILMLLFQDLCNMADWSVQELKDVTSANSRTLAGGGGFQGGSGGGGSYGGLYGGDDQGGSYGGDESGS